MGSGVDLETLPGTDSPNSSLQRPCDTCHARGETTAGVRYCEDCSKVMCGRHEEVSCHYNLTENWTGDWRSVVADRQYLYMLLIRSVHT